MSSRDLCPRRVHVSINGAASELYLEISRPALEWGWCASAWVLEGLPFECRACGLAMRAGAKTPGRGAHACCVEGASGGAKTVSEEKSEGPCLRTQKSTAHSRQTDLRWPRPSVTQEFPPDALYLFYPLASRFGLEFILPRVPSSASLFPLRCDLPIRFSRRDWGLQLEAPTDGTAAKFHNSWRQAGSTGRVVRRIGNERVHDAGEGRCRAHGDGTDAAHQHPQPHRAEGEGAHPTDAPNDDNPTAPRSALR